MKKFLTLRNVLIAAGTLLGVLVFIFSFLAVCRTEGTALGTSYVSKVHGIIWGGYKSVTVSGNSTNIQKYDKADPACVLPLIGSIMILLGAVCACLVVFLGDKISFLKDEKVRKIVLLVCGGMMVLGGIFWFFINLSYANAMVRDAKANGFNDYTQKDALDALKDAKASYGLVIVGGILAVLGGGAIVASQFIADKQLAK